MRQLKNDPTMPPCSSMVRKIIDVLENLVPNRLRTCRACNKRNCICWRNNRRDGVLDEHMASVGEPINAFSGARPAAGDHRPGGGAGDLGQRHVHVPFPNTLSAPSAGDPVSASPSDDQSYPSPVYDPLFVGEDVGGGVRRPGAVAVSASPAAHHGTDMLMTQALAAPVGDAAASDPTCGGGTPHEDFTNFNTLSTSSPSSSNTNTTASSSSSSGASHKGGAILSPMLDLLVMDCNGGGSGADDNYQTGSGDGSECEPCHIHLEERLAKTYPIWFLPDLQRSGAAHLLQGKDEGNFIVRQSSKTDTLALSVRLPQDKGPYIQHYLIEIHNKATYSLEASDNRFDTPPALIAHYSQCCDELPVQLRLPRAVQEARTRHELASLALLGQEFWDTPMASPTANTPTADAPRSVAPTPSPRPHELSFSSFGKGGVTRGISSSSLLSPNTQGFCGNSLAGSLAGSIGGSTSSLTPQRPAPPIPSPGDRSSLNLNLAPLDEILKEQPMLSSFRSQPATPVTPLKPGTPGTKPMPPPRSSPPGTQKLNHASPPGSHRHLVKPTPPARHSPPIMCDAGTPSSENGDMTPRSGQAPIPPPRWARPTITSTSTSNITVTTTLTLNVNQVKALPVQIGEDGQQGMSVHVASLEISPTGSSNSQSYMAASPNGNHITNHTGTLSGTLNGHRDALQLQIRQHITSPQSTPCTPCAPGTPLGEEAPGMPRVRLRSGRQGRRRLSNHYHESNIVENNAPYCRSSLADKISDYEDLWSSPPRELPPTPTSAQPKMSTFKPRNEISKSMGDLSEISKNTKPVTFAYETETRKEEESFYDNGKLNGTSTDSVNSYRKNPSPFYMEPADALREQQPQARINKASNKSTRKITNRYSDSNIQWKSRKSRNSLSKIDSNEDLPLSSSTENLENGKNLDGGIKHADVERNRNLEVENNEVNASHLINGHSRNDVRRNSRAGGRGKPIAPPRIGRESLTPNGERTPEVPWRVDSSWEYLGVGEEDEAPGGEGRFPVNDNGGESDSVIIPGERTVQDMISEKLDLTPLDDQSLAPSYTTRVSEYDNVASHANVKSEDHLQQQRPLAQQHQKPTRNIPLEERLQPPLPTHYFASTVSDSGTEFSEPWDSRKWESMLHSEDDSSVDQFPRSPTCTPALQPPEDSDIGGGAITDTESIVHITGEPAVISDDDTTSVSGVPTLSLPHAHNLDTHLRSRISESKNAKGNIFKAFRKWLHS